MTVSLTTTVLNSLLAIVMDSSKSHNLEIMAHKNTPKLSKLMRVLRGKWLGHILNLSP